MTSTKKEAVDLWNIASTAATRSINGELSNQDFKREIKRFRTKLNQVIKRTHSKP